MPYLSANGIDLYYEEEGTGQPVLFIHGGFGGAESTLFPKPSAVTGLLSREAFRTISFDRRNSGRSGYCLDETSLEDLHPMRPASLLLSASSRRWWLVTRLAE